MVIGNQGKAGYFEGILGSVQRGIDCDQSGCLIFVFFMLL